MQTETAHAVACHLDHDARRVLCPLFLDMRVPDQTQGGKWLDEVSESCQILGLRFFCVPDPQKTKKSVDGVMHFVYISRTTFTHWLKGDGERKTLTVGAEFTTLDFHAEALLGGRSLLHAHRYEI